MNWGVHRLDHGSLDFSLFLEPVNFVRSGLGYFLTTRDLLPDTLSADVCFRPLTPTLETHYALVWKQSAVLSRAAQAFLEEVRGQLENDK